jgi:bifunctional non-homologous end joining protein LigD
VYSLRAKERPTVSTPVEWEEVERCLEKKDPKLLVFDSADVLKRVEAKGDLFELVLKMKQKLPALGAVEGKEATVAPPPPRKRAAPKKEEIVRSRAPRRDSRRARSG